MKKIVLTGAVGLVVFVGLWLVGSSSAETEAVKTPATEPGPGLSTHLKSNPHMSVPVVEGDKKERVFSIEDIVSPILPNSSKVEPLELKWIFSERFVNFSQLYVTVHKGKGRPDRLALYFCEKGKYQLLKTIEAEGTASDFAKPNFFHYDFDKNTRKTFLHVPMRYHGTGGFRKERIFCFKSGGRVSVSEVNFESASKPLSQYLSEGERTTSYEYYNFSDDSLKFTFYILKDTDHYKHPTAGYVTGTYKITQRLEAKVALRKRVGSLPVSIKPSWPIKYDMKVHTWQREPVKRDRSGFPIKGWPWP